ncbi:transglutaminase-like domain-containing protein [Lachnoclostridium edouardi]|uniref:transglutaminase-like domain-containing protein n=1 Tax=Lachnoclostridium edouardi TaxID=1926283 RepID=UPI000C7E4871|nr:transglutaminase-like domain-containing protein [Lachnoclostridium edouardi]
MRKEKIFALTFAAAISLSLTMPVLAGEWEKEEQGSVTWRYKGDDGSYLKNEWLETDGKWYYLDENGIMVTGSYIVNGKEEQFGTDGVWIDTSKAQEASNADNSLMNYGPGISRWGRDDRGWYYQNFDGSRVQNTWEEIWGVWYYFNGEGYMMENAWIDTNGKRYRVGEDGAMLTSQTITVDGIQYDLGEDGSVPVPAKTEEELQAEAVAAGIIASITNNNMSKPQKASAIYQYVRANTSYTYGGLRPESGDAAAALYGFRRHSGNCFEYYAMSKYLLEAAGMPNVRVTRASDGDHFWNLVNVDGTWYHFDATPRRTGGTWCLVTTGHLRNSWGVHNYDVAAYPATP